MGCLVLCAAAYLIMSRLYDGRFGYGTWVNGYYVTGLSPQEVTTLLDSQMGSENGQPAVVMLIGRDEAHLAIPTDSLSMKASYASAVKHLYQSQNPLTWLGGIFGGLHYSVTPKTSFDLTALETAVDGWNIFDGTAKEEERARIELTPAGYQLINPTKDTPVKEAIIEAAAEKIGGGEFFVSLDTDKGCYVEHEETEADRSVLATWDAIQKTRLPELYYIIGGERIALDASVTDAWLMTAQELHAIQNGAGHPAAASADGEEEEGTEGETLMYMIGGERTALPEDVREVNGFAQSADGELIIKEEEIGSFINALCERYSTLDKVRDFTTADGCIIQVPAGTYGNRIDEEAETAWLMDAVQNHTQEEHTPILLQEARCLGDDDIGGTYIEVDISKQTLYYFVNGQLDTEIPVVTGNHAVGNDTPPGVYDIYYMQRNRTLRGPGYTSFVHYWIAFYGHYGIHDATWRSSFGDEIYRTSGSHGCVNIPLELAGPLYQKLSVGVPVVVHE